MVFRTMREEGVMEPNNTLHSHLSDPQRSGLPVPPIQSVSALRTRTHSSKRRRQRQRRKRMESVPESNKLDDYLKKAGHTFATYLKGRMEQHNTSEKDASYEMSKFINAVKSRVPGRTCIDAVWDLLEFAEGPHHCSRLLAEKFDQRFVPFQEQSGSDQPPEGPKLPGSSEADSVPLDETSMNLLALNHRLENPIPNSNSAVGSSIDVKFQTSSFENQWEEQPGTDTQFY